MIRPSVSIRRGLCLSLCLAAMGLLFGLASSTATAANDGGLLSVLVMGDSYSAGNGAGSYYAGGPTKCYRSSRNYAREFEREVEKSGQRLFVENVACSGAVTTDFFGRQAHRNVPAQIRAVNHGYDLIFLTIGGNDLAFADIVTHCLVKAKRSAKDCKPLLDEADKMLAGDFNGRNLERRIRSVLFAIKQDADPRAKVVLVGYPHLEGDLDYELTTRGIRQRETVRVGARLRAIGREGDKLQERVVRQLNQQFGGGFVFVPTKALFGATERCGSRFFTHELYADYVNCARWLVGPALNEDVTISKDTYYHPNPRGWREIALLLARDPRVPKRDLNSGPPPSLMPPSGGSAPIAPVDPGPIGPVGPISGPGSGGVMEQQGSLGANTFQNPYNASGQGPKIPAMAWVEVSCKVYAPQIVSANPDGYWYRIASAPWNNAYYAVANTFWNGDIPGQRPYTHNTDFAVPDCSDPPTAPAPSPPATWAEQQGSLGANTFTNPFNASGLGTKIAPYQWVDVSCKVYAPQVASANPDGYWYRIASAPWNNAYYAVANTFWNGDIPGQRPYTHNTDFAVPNC